MSGSSLESRYCSDSLAGLLTCASSNRSAFPFRCRNSGLFGRFSALTVAGLCWIFTSFPCTSGIFDYASECTLISEAFPCELQLPIWRDSPCCSAAGGRAASRLAADAKPDKKKSQAALLRGKKADEAGQRDEAIAAYTEAIQADAVQCGCVRARGQDYQAAGDAGQGAGRSGQGRRIAARQRRNLSGARRCSSPRPDRPSARSTITPWPSI